MFRLRLFGLAVLLFAVVSADAMVPRGGGRGGGGGGVNRGGGGRPAGGAGGRPSAPMARPAQRPSAPARPSPGPRPSGGARPSAPNRPGGSPGGINRPNPGVNRPSPLPGNRPNVGQGAVRPQPSPRPGGGGIGIGGTRPGTTLPGSRPNLPDRPGINDRPNVRPTPLPSRPDVGGGDRPNVRPTPLPSRPGQGGGGVQWPNRPDGGGDRFPNRPDIGNRPNWPNTRPNRPDGGGGGDRFPNRPDNGNRPNWPDNRPNRPDWSGGNRPPIGSGNNWWSNNNVNNFWNNSVNVNRPWSPGWGAGGHWGDGLYCGYGGNVWHNGYPPYYGGWFNGAWRWNGPTWWGVGSAYTAGFLAGGATSYYNPYYVAPVAGTTVVYNYSEPLPVNEPQTIYVESAPTTVVVQDAPVASPTIPDAPAPQSPSADAAIDPKVAEAGQRFERARAAFKAGSYADALAGVDAAIAAMPKDSALHEFRALCLFAQKKYQDAAGVLYSVLAVGPGWTWDTVKQLYENQSTYEQQLKSLSEFMKANPKDAASRFVLAYHSLVLDDRAEAVRLLNEVVALNPKDELAAAMAKAIGQSLAPAENKPKIGS